MMSLIFAWLNFAIFIMIGRYIYRKWFKTQLCTSLKLKQDEFKKMQNEVGSLESQIKELTLDLVLQQKQSTDLLSKLKQWRAVFMDDQQLELQKIAHLQAIIAQNKQTKLQNIALKLTQKHLLMDIVPQVSDLLHEQFRSPDKAKSMLFGALEKLERQ